MAMNENEILQGLAEIVNEETGLDAAEVQMDKSFTEDHLEQPPRRRHRSRCHDARRR